METVELTESTIFIDDLLAEVDELLLISVHGETPDIE